MYRQCEAKTKKGERCRGGAMAGSLYCGPHTDHSVVQEPKGFQLTNARGERVYDWFDDPEVVAGYLSEMEK